MKTIIATLPVARQLCPFTENLGTVTKLASIVGPYLHNLPVYGGTRSRWYGTLLRSNMYVKHMST